MPNGGQYPIGPGAGPGVEAAGMLAGGADPEKLGYLARGKQWLGKPEGKLTAGSIIGFMLLDKLLRMRHESGMRNIQLEGMERQAEMATPENLYAQAALPQAQQEEQMARNAFLLQLSGGVLGPQAVARGNRMIGG